MSGQRQPVDSGARNDDMTGSGVGDADQTLPHEMSDQKVGLSWGMGKISFDWKAFYSNNDVDWPFLNCQAQPEFHQPHTTKLLSSNDEPSTSANGSSHNLSCTSEHAENFEGPTRSNHGNDNIDGSAGVPLGLGLGGLQPKVVFLPF